MLRTHLWVHILKNKKLHRYGLRYEEIKVSKTSTTNPIMISFKYGLLQFFTKTKRGTWMPKILVAGPLHQKIPFLKILEAGPFHEQGASMN